MAKDTAKNAYEWYDFDHEITHAQSTTIEGIFWSNELTDEDGNVCYILAAADITPGLADDEDVIDDFKLDVNYYYFDENDDEITAKSFMACSNDMTEEALDSIESTIEDILYSYAEKDDNLTLYYTQQDLWQFEAEENEKARRKGEW